MAKVKGTQNNDLAHLFIQGMYTGDVISRLGAGNDREAQKALVKLLGSDLQRLTLARYLLAVEQAFCKPDLRQIARRAIVHMATTGQLDKLEDMPVAIHSPTKKRRTSKR